LFKEQIDKGKEVLDNFYGTESWVLEIDLGELNLKSGCNCVLGQLNGDYDHMLFELDMEEADAVEHGFCLDFHDEKIYTSDVDWWEKLTEEWRVAIKDRLDVGIEL
jgi:hypothetical protein